MILSSDPVLRSHRAIFSTADPRCTQASARQSRRDAVIPEHRDHSVTDPQLKAHALSGRDEAPLPSRKQNLLAGPDSLGTVPTVFRVKMS
jgi:hypothetical protein